MANLLLADPSSQLVQNRRADDYDLSRMSNVAMIQRFRRNGYLSPVPAATRHYYIHAIPAKYRYLRPWSKLFLTRLSSQFYARFRKRLRVTSLVRTVALQNALARRNGNAADAYGERRSSHLTGATLDISKKGMTSKQLNWMRRVIHSLKKRGYLYAVEEFQQPAFHIMVYQNYPQYVKGLRLKKASIR
ncbi:MAG: DUF5715 family protein [Bryobacteraceae bacterium]